MFADQKWWFVTVVIEMLDNFSDSQYSNYIQPWSQNMPTCSVKVYYFNTKDVMNLIAVEFFTTTNILDEMLISIRDVLQDHGLPFGFVHAKLLYSPRLELKYMNVTALENKRSTTSKHWGHDFCKMWWFLKEPLLYRVFTLLLSFAFVLQSCNLWWRQSDTSA